MGADGLRDQLRGVTLPRGEARPFAARWFWDETLFRWEMEALFARGFFAAGSEAELPRAGDWARVPYPDERLVIARGGDLEVTAFHDVCPHRGSALLDGDRGHLPGLHLTCPYHGKVMALSPDGDGEFLSRGRRPPGGTTLPCATDDEPAHAGEGSVVPPGGLRPRLKHHPTTARWGQVFTTLHGDGATLDEVVGPPWLSTERLSPLRRAAVRRWEVAANWKLVMENFQESEHFPSTHPGLEALTPARRSRSVTHDPRWLGGVMELADGVETVSMSGSRSGRPWIVAEGRREVRDALVFPNLLTSLQPDYLLVYRVHPTGPERTVMACEFMLHASAIVGSGGASLRASSCPRSAPPEPPGDPAMVEDLTGFWERVHREDALACERQQRSVRSRAWRWDRYGDGDDGLHAFDRGIATRLLAALDGGLSP